MLNGLEPVIIFNFEKLIPGLEAAVKKIPVLSTIQEKIGFAPIPVYLSERLTGLYIDTEDKSLDIETQVTTLTDGSKAIFKQKGLSSSVRVNLIARKGSIGLTLLSALSDLIFDKVTSAEYSVTYLHKSVVIFKGLISSFQISQNASNDLLNISFEIIRTVGQPDEVAPSATPVPTFTGAVPISG